MRVMTDAPKHAKTTLTKHMQYMQFEMVLAVFCPSIREWLDVLLIAKSCVSNCHTDQQRCKEM
jgi:hypothetical protein